MQPRKQKILNDLKDVMSDLGGLDRDKIADQSTFLELGFDSLFLAQMSAAFKKKFAVNVTFRQLLEEVPSPEALAHYIDSQLPSEVVPISEPQEPIGRTKPVTPSCEMSLPQPISRSIQSFSASVTQTANPKADQVQISSSAFERLMSQQLQIMARQLEVLKHCRTSHDAGGIEPTVVSNGADGHSIKSLAHGETPKVGVSQSNPALVPNKDQSEVSRFGPWRPIDKSGNRSLEPEQRRHLDALIERYTRRTLKSKELTAAHRAHFADPRSVAGFCTEWKEMVYPIVSVRSAGSKLWDIDGNEYVDMMMGFGPALFGHSPDFVTRALKDQINRGIEIGPQSPLVGEVARLVCDFTGMERVTFCNTGSEAVLAALRVARTVTGRSKIALFAGSYHGIFDEVLVRPITAVNGRNPVPAAPGIPRHMVQDVLVLRYGDPDSLKIVKQHAEELAAVLVEPVQSRNPDLQPKEFLQALRKLTAESDIALIFDEVITGFRLHPGGAQAWFDVQADLATYGKALGGGLPIGALAGKARFMDALDGGAWNYGDSSVPEVGVTYFAGTFVRHPLAIAAATAVLHQLKQSGPELYRELNKKASCLARELNQHFEEMSVPFHIQQCGSLFCVSFSQETRFSSLLFFYLREKGVHIWEGRPTFISTAHSNEDLSFVTRAMMESVEEMQKAGFLPRDESRRTVAKVKPADFSEQSPSISAPTFSIASYEFPLTEAQMEIWLATSLGDDASQAFNENILLQFKGTLDLEAMRSAIQRTIDRHDALRTTFSVDGSYQRINSPYAIAMPLIDLSRMGDAEKTNRFQELIAGELQQPFDLVNGPLVRVSILRLEPEIHTLLITAHHLVCDGWSIHVLLSDLSVLYTAKDGTATDLPTPTPLREYALWQLKQQATPEGLATERYWLDRFADPVPALKLPTDHARSSFRTFAGGCERKIINKAMHIGMKQLGASQGSTAFTVFLAVFKVLLHHLTAQTDIVVGIGIAGQSIVGIDSLVGHCVNTLPMRSQVATDQLFTEFLKSVNRTFLDAYEHQNYTFGTIVRKLNLSRDSSQIPLISVMFNMDQELEGLRFKDLEFELQPDPHPYVNFELYFNLFEKQGSLILECEYNRDLFDPTTIRRWIGHYENLLREILADPARPISTLSLLSKEERQQLLVEWNRTQSSCPRDESVHQLFEAQVDRTPDRVAVVFEDSQLTYRELNQRANQLAHHLQKLGVGPEVMVAICIERSIEMVVGLLGVLKAGGAYVPLDPQYSKDRLSFMLAETQAPVLLTQCRLVENVDPHRSQVVCLDTDWKEITRHSQHNPSHEVTPENLAYVIYTSGSTGRPKGVMVTHGGLTNYLNYCLTTYPISEGRGSIVHSTIAFDATITALFAPLLTGLALYLLPQTEDLEALAAILRRERNFSLVKITPSHLTMLSQQIPAEEVQGLTRAFVIGGENLVSERIAFWQKHAKDTLLFNEYGPTETVVGCIVYEASGWQGRGSVPIGRPIPNTIVYVLDRHRRPVPIGVPGELYIGGSGVARGYLNRPELTAERFIANPFSDKPQSRLYKTGDLVRYLPNGEIEFLGRTDHQVKIRGFRIELGEIENVLTQHAALRETVVVAQDDLFDEKRLVAYVVSNQEMPPTDGELRNYSKEKLPEYMVPSAFVFLNVLPLLPNGKIDRRALPKPERGRKTDLVHPRTQVEEILAEIWRDVFGVKQVSVHDNFFDLGGHSLLAMQMITRLRKTFELELPLRYLFQFPTIAGLAVQISDGKKRNIRKRPYKQGAGSSLFEFLPGSTGQPVFFFPGGTGGDSEFLIYARMAHYVGLKYAFYGLRAQSADGIRTAHNRVEEMAADYLEEIRSVQSEGPYFLVGNCTGGVVAYEIARHLETEGQKIALLAIMDTERPTMLKYFRYRVAGLAEPIFSWWRESYHICRSRFHWKQISRLGWDEMLPYILAKGTGMLSDISKVRVQNAFASRKATGQPLQHVNKLQQGYEETLRRYTPRGYQGRITLLINEQAYEHDPSLGWSGLATGGIDIYKVQGNHESYIRDHVQAVALQLRACLEKTEKESRISSGPERSVRDHVSQTKTHTWKHEVDFRFG